MQTIDSAYCGDIDYSYLEEERKKKKEEYENHLYLTTGWKKTKYGYLSNPIYSIIHDVYAKKFDDGYALKANEVILVNGITEFREKYNLNGGGEISTRLYKINYHIFE